jgi:hypothetical protein
LPPRSALTDPMARRDEVARLYDASTPCRSPATIWSIWERSANENDAGEPLITIGLILDVAAAALLALDLI